MANRLKIDLPPTWSESHGDDPQGPPTYIRHASGNPGALQVSWASYGRSGPPPKMTDDGLVQLAARLVESSGGTVHSSTTGNSKWGRFGCVEASTADHQMRVWVINRSGENVLVTHTASDPIDEDELAEAEEIAMSIAVTEGG